MSDEVDRPRECNVRRPRGDEVSLLRQVQKHRYRKLSFIRYPVDSTGRTLQRFLSRRISLQFLARLLLSHCLSGVTNELPIHCAGQFSGLVAGRWHRVDCRRRAAPSARSKEVSRVVSAESRSIDCSVRFCGSRSCHCGLVRLGTGEGSRCRSSVFRESFRDFAKPFANFTDRSRVFAQISMS